MGMSAALDTYFETAMTGVHTSLPGKIVSYDKEKHRAKVKPAIRLLMSNGVKVEIPELLDVPVLFPSAKSFDLEFPLDKDDGVMLLFQEQDILAWKTDEKNATPATASRFNLDSAVAVPGLFANPQKGKVRIYVNEDGILTWEARKIVFKGQFIVDGDLIARKDIFVGEGTGPGISMQQHIHPSGAGPTSPPNPVTPIPLEEN